MLYNKDWDKKLTSEVSLVYPSMAGLVHLLRNPQLWPEKNVMPSGYVAEIKDGAWAIGYHLACAYWPNSVTDRVRRGSDLTQMLAMGLKDDTSEDYSHHRIFYAMDGKGRYPSAELVAGRLEAFMNRHDKQTNAYKALMAMRLGC